MSHGMAQVVAYHAGGHFLTKTFNLTEEEDWRDTAGVRVSVWLRLNSYVLGLVIKIVRLLCQHSM